jgi:transglutaminase/protease-like cytokinesis protein 3
MMLKKITPFLFVITVHISYAQRSDFWNTNFTKADSVANLYLNVKLNDIDKLALDLTKGLSTDVEKFRAIFYWTTKNISYDYALYLEQQAKEKKYVRNPSKRENWRNRFSKKMMRRLIRDKTAICSGYAMLLDQMCSKVGIPCAIISGYGRTSEENNRKIVRADHAWNSVQLQNKWYLCDATWASGYYDDYKKRFTKDFDENYFLTDPSLLVANHYPTDTSWTLLLQTPTLREFLNAPVKTSYYLKYKLNTYSPSSGVIRIKKGAAVDFQFSCNEKNIRQPTLSKTSTIKILSSVYEMAKNKEGNYAISHIFEETGTYEMKVNINDRCVLAYDVIVNK